MLQHQLNVKLYPKNHTRISASNRCEVLSTRLRTRQNHEYPLPVGNRRSSTRINAPEMVLNMPKPARLPRLLPLRVSRLDLATKAAPERLRAHANIVAPEIVVVGHVDVMDFFQMVFQVVWIEEADVAPFVNEAVRFSTIPDLGVRTVGAFLVLRPFLAGREACVAVSGGVDAAVAQGYA
jgi:hypothetical protein